MRVVLVGYRGTGKSTVARILAERLGWSVASSDTEICSRSQQSIPQIVAERGWSGFRDLEETVLRELLQHRQIVLDCGGGVVEREANLRLLIESSPVVWLQASPAAIVARIAADDQRPSLTAARSFTEEVEEVLARRRPLYDQVSDYRVDTEGKEPTDIALEIMELVADQIDSTAVRGLRDGCPGCR